MLNVASCIHDVKFLDILKLFTLVYWRTFLLHNKLNADLNQAEPPERIQKFLSQRHLQVQLGVVLDFEAFNNTSKT